jgi:hypothetical protein
VSLPSLSDPIRDWSLSVVEDDCRTFPERRVRRAFELLDEEDDLALTGCGG